MSAMDSRKHHWYHSNQQGSAAGLTARKTRIKRLFKKVAEHSQCIRLAGILRKGQKTPHCQEHRRQSSNNLRATHLRMAGVIDGCERGGCSQLAAADNPRLTLGDDHRVTASALGLAPVEGAAAKKGSAISQKFPSSPRLETMAASMAHADGAGEAAGEGADTLRRCESAEGRFTILDERIKDSTDQSFDDSSCDESDENAATLCIKPSGVSCSNRRDVPSRDECSARLTSPVRLPTRGVTPVKQKEEGERPRGTGNNATLTRASGGMGSRFKIVPVEAKYKRGRWEAYDYYEGDENIGRSKFLRVHQGPPRVVTHPPTPPAMAAASTAAIHPSASEANLASPSPGVEAPQSLTNSLMRCISPCGVSTGEGKENLRSDNPALQHQPQTRVLLLRPRTQSNSTPASLTSRFGSTGAAKFGRITPSEMLHHYGLETSLSVASAHNMGFLHPLSGDATQKAPLPSPLLPGIRRETRPIMAATTAPALLDCPLQSNNLPVSRPRLCLSNDRSFDHEGLYSLLYNALHAQPKPPQKENHKRARRSESESDAVAEEEMFGAVGGQLHSFAESAPPQPNVHSHPVSSLSPGGLAATGTGTFAASQFSIDSKIEQAMDLVKTHLMFAVREEVEILRAKIVELESTVIHLEAENSILREHVPLEVLQSLDIRPHHQSQLVESRNDGTNKTLSISP